MGLRAAQFILKDLGGVVVFVEDSSSPYPTVNAGTITVYLIFVGLVGFLCYVQSNSFGQTDFGDESKLISRVPVGSFNGFCEFGFELGHVEEVVEGCSVPID